MDETETLRIEEEIEYIYKPPTARTIVLTMVLAFVLPIMIMALALLKIQVWPGGKFTLYVYDMQGCFGPLITSLRYLGNGDSSVFYSFFGALGNNAFLNYSGYILDPTNWASVLFPMEQMPDVIYFITLFKIGLCGLGASIYFLFGIKEKKNPLVILILSVCYALMSYNIMYSQCIMWFNVIALAPVTIFGIEKIIEGRKGGIYILCMTLSLYYNYQLSFMVGIFSVLYLLIRLSEIHEGRIRISIRFVICNILCIGLFMPVVLSVIPNVISGRMKMDNPMAGRLFYYPFWKVAKQFLSCQYSTIESRGLPNLFCGTFVPLIAFSFFFIPLKPIITRVISALVLVFFMLSLCIVPLNQFWHGFNEPNSFPARYSFLLCFYLLILAYHAISYACGKVKISVSTMYLLYGIALLLACIEMYLNAGFVLSSFNLDNNYNIRSAYQLQLSKSKDVLKHVDDEDFYRIGRDLSYSLNDGMLYGYNGIGYFSSMFERRTMEFIGMLGYSQREHTLRETGGTPLSESLLGIKYKIAREPELFGYYKSIYNNGFYDLQYNESALPLGFTVKYHKYSPDTDPILSSYKSNHNAFLFQEFIISEIYGERVHVFENVDYSLEELETDDFERYIKMEFTAANDKPVWIYCKDEHDGRYVSAPRRSDYFSRSGNSYSSSDEQMASSILKVNGKEVYPFVNSLSTMCIYLGTFKKGEKVEVEAACISGFDDPWLVYFDTDKCEEVLSSIGANGFEVSEHSNGVIKGKINVRDKDEIMVLTLPFMRGYNIRVDGEKTDYGYYREAFLAIKMDPGEHTVEISFIPPGLIPGGIIGTLFLVLSILYLRGYNNPGLRERNEEAIY